MTNDMLKAFQIIDKFDHDYAPSTDGLPILIDLVYYYPAKREYEIAKEAFYKAALDYCRMTP